MASLWIPLLPTPLPALGPSISASGAALQHPWAVAWRRPRRVATATEPSLSIPPTPLPWPKLGERKISWGGDTFPPPGWQAQGQGN